MGIFSRGKLSCLKSFIHNTPAWAIIVIFGLHQFLCCNDNYSYYCYHYSSILSSKLEHIVILRPSLPKFVISGQDPQFEISYIWLTSLTCSESQISLHWEHISFLGSIFSGMRGLILVLMSNMCYLAVTWWLLGGYCSLPSGYCSLLLITWWLLLIAGGYWLLPLATIVPTFSMNSRLAPYLVWRFLRTDQSQDLISCQTRPFPQISKFVPKLN